MQKKWSVFLLMTLWCLAVVPKTHAGIISSFDIAYGGSYFSGGSFSVWNPNQSIINNDNSSNYANAIAIGLNYVGIGPVDVVYSVADSGGVSEYRSWNLSNPSYYKIENNGLEAWRDFHIYLGYGYGDNFILSGTDDMLDFDTPHRDSAPTSTVFASLSHLDDELAWTGGSVAPGQSVIFEYRFDLPDSGSGMPTSALITNGYKMTLRFTPSAEGAGVIPEPSSMLLLGIGFMGAQFFRKKKKA